MSSKFSLRSPQSQGSHKLGNTLIGQAIGSHLDAEGVWFNDDVYS